MSETSREFPPERSFLARIRSWRDLLPWLGLVDALRPCTSIVSLALVALATFAAVALETSFESLLVRSDSSQPTAQPDVAFPNAAIGFGNEIPLRLIAGPSCTLLFGETSYNDKTSTNVTRATGYALALRICHQWLLLCVWAVPAGYVMRQSGLCMGGRILLGTSQTLRLVVSRFFSYIGVAFIPFLVCLLAFACIWMIGLIERIPAIGRITSLVFDTLFFPFAFLAGLIGFASVLAVPLGWAAVSLERDGSSFDGISRGFEYVFRRPLHWFAYVVIGIVVMFFLTMLAEGVRTTANAIIEHGYKAAGSATTVQLGWSRVLVDVFPMVVQLSVFWSLVAWLYLLLRYSANHQEIEDLWEQPRPPAVPLPTLKPSPDQSSEN